MQRPPAGALWLDIRKRRRIANARHVGEIFSRAPLGHDAREQSVASALNDFDFDAREFFFELAQEAKFSKRVIGDLAL
jgi:hypothetical protein